MSDHPALFSTALPPDEVSMSRRLAGLLFLAICLLGSLMLVLRQFGVEGLPGLGPESDSVRAVSGQWGEFLGWPVSFIGLAYFAGLAAAWLFTTAAGVPMLFRAAVRLAVLASVTHLVILFLEGYGCLFCIAIHVSNLVFWVIVERTQRSMVSSPGAIVTLVSGSAVVLAMLNVFVSEQERMVTERSGRDTYQSLAEVSVDQDAPGPTAETPPAEMTFAKSDSMTPAVGVPSSDSSLSAGTQGPSHHDAEVDADRQNDEPPDSAAETPPVSAQDDVVVREPYRLGQANARVKLTVFYDYQSVHCWRIENEIQSLLDRYGDRMSVTARHYPLCSECNFLVDATTNANACRAALAAETAGILGGNDGFWKMHTWLIQRRGEFTDDQLKEGLLSLGYEDVDSFVELMHSPQPLGAILADIIEARSIGVQGIPAVLFNGERLNIGAGTLIDGLRAVAQRKTPPVPGEKPPETSPVDLKVTAAFPEQMQRRVALSTVRIANPADRSIGSGAIIAVRDAFVYVLTAQHLLSDSKRVEVQTFSEQSYPEPAGIYSYSTVVATSAEADLAVVRFATRDSMPDPLAVVSPELLPRESGFPVLTVGCNSGEMAPSGVGAEVIEAKRVRRTAGGPPVTVWEVDRESVEGRSGGPLIDTRGLVIGVASGISEGKGYFTHADEVHRFLEKTGLQALLDSGRRPE